MSKDTEKQPKEQIQFQYYAGDILACRPLGVLTLPQFVCSISHPKHPEYFTRIQEATAAGDEATRTELKKKLFSFTPAVIVSGWRAQRYITHFTGLFPVDFDKMHTDHAVEFKRILFDYYPCFYAVWLSASKHGVRGLIRVPEIQTVEEYRQYYYSIEAEFGQYPYRFDTQMKNPVQPMFQAYDPDILYRDDPEEWTEKANRELPPPPSELVNIKDNYSETQRQKAAEILFKGFTTRFRKITDVGHPNVRSIAYTAGGYISGGYLDELDVIQFMESWIDTHGYLSQKADTYKRTVRDMINRGKAKPLQLSTTYNYAK